MTEHILNPQHINHYKACVKKYVMQQISGTITVKNDSIMASTDTSIVALQFLFIVQIYKNTKIIISIEAKD